MWETIENVLISNNGIAISVLLIVLITILIISSKNGLLKIKTNKIQIGKDASEKERTIMRNQVEWCKVAVLGSDSKIQKPEGFNFYRSKYILEKVFDEVISWIMFNHIVDNSTYVQIKQELVWNLIQTLVEDDNLGTDELKEIVFNQVEYVIKNLVKIRKEYQ